MSNAKEHFIIYRIAADGTPRYFDQLCAADDGSDYAEWTPRAGSALGFRTQAHALGILPRIAAAQKCAESHLRITTTVPY